jgi:hypothetical protein
MSTVSDPVDDTQDGLRDLVGRRALWILCRFGLPYERREGTTWEVPGRAIGLEPFLMSNEEGSHYRFGYSQGPRLPRITPGVRYRVWYYPDVHGLRYTFYLVPSLNAKAPAFLLVNLAQAPDDYRVSFPEPATVRGGLALVTGQLCRVGTGFLGDPFWFVADLVVVSSDRIY